MEKVRMTQFCVTAEVKDRFDRYKMANKEQILRNARATRRLVSNDATMRYLLDCAGAKK